MAMIMSKYGAVKEFYNKLSEHLNLENRSAKNFKEIVNQHLEFILPVCAKEDEAPTNVISQALSILGKSTFIPYLREINETLAAKGDEEEIGKILVGVFYELRVRQPTTVQKVIQSMQGDCRLEIIHIIRFLDSPDNWPPKGSWTAILCITPPVELQEEWLDHENSILGDITNAEPDRRRQSIIMRTPLSRTQGKQRLMTAHRSPLHIVMHSPIGQERMRVAELEKEIVSFQKKNRDLLQQIQDIAEETDKEHDDLKQKITTIKIEKSQLESTKRRLEHELDAARLDAFEFHQRYNEQSADLISLTEERDKLVKERDALKNSIAKLVEDYESRTTPSVNHEMNRRMEEVLDLKLKLANIELEKSELESMKKRLERELDAAHLNAFEFRQRCNEQSADLISLTEERDKLAKERDSLKNSIAKLVEDYESRGKAVAALEETHKELNERLRKKNLENADLEEGYSNLRKEMRKVELRSVAKQEEYATVVRAKYESEIDALKKAVETAAADAIEKSKKEKAELEARLAEVTVASETKVKEAEARVQKFKEISEKAKRDAEGFFKDSLRAKEEIERQKMELIERCTTIAELANDLDEQENAWATHEADLAAAQKQIAKLEAEKVARQLGAKALQNLPFSLNQLLPMPTFELAAPTTKSVEVHPDYLVVSTGSIDGLSLDGAPLTIQDLFIDPPQIQMPRPSLATVFTACSGTPLRSEIVSSTPRMSLSKSARKSISRMFRHRNHHN